MSIRLPLLCCLLLAILTVEARAQSTKRLFRKPVPAAERPPADPGEGSSPARGRFQKRGQKSAPPEAASAKPGPAGRSPAVRAMPLDGSGQESAANPLAAVPRRSSRQLRIFVFGDSQGHSEFGPELQKQLLLGGHEVLFHAVKNGTPYYWAGQWKSPVLTRIFQPAAEPEEAGRFEQISLVPRSVAAYVEAFDPDVFVFQAGTNFDTDLAKKENAQIKRLVAASAAAAASRGALVLWIGPPDARDDVKSEDLQQRSIAALREALAPLAADQGSAGFFDSRPSSPMPNSASGDGEHPGPAVARQWAREAAAWTLDAVKGFRRDSARLAARGPAESRPHPFADVSGGAKPAKTYPMRLKLLEKSRIEDPKTMEYTDAFSVYKYLLLNPGEVLRKLDGVTLTSGGEGASPFVYVLHWTAHHDGKAAARTQVAAMKEGSSVRLRLTPLDAHPLRQALATMRQYNDFDDFSAPIFVASNLLEERSF